MYIFIFHSPRLKFLRANSHTIKHRHIINIKAALKPTAQTYQNPCICAET